MPQPSRVAVVIPAAGSGSRMRAEPGAPAKQFRTLGGAPVLVHTLRVFASHPEVGPVVVVVPESETRTVREALREHGAEPDAVVAGGATRQASVAAGLTALDDSVSFALVHDAVRPFLPADRLTALIGAIYTHGAAALAVPVADTLRRGKAGAALGATVPREGLWQMQTPQGARLDWLRHAHALAADAGHLATDEVALLQDAGYAVRVVEGDARTFKITRPSDWPLAVAIFQTLARAD